MGQFPRNYPGFVLSGDTSPSSAKSSYCGSEHGPNVSRIACDMDAIVPRIETETYVPHEGDATWWKDARVPEEAWSELARIEARPERMYEAE